MASKKSLGSNPLGKARKEPVLREALGVEPKAEATALVLSGRGAEGAFEAGVLAGLAASDGLDFDVVTGLSVGALNAALLSGHPGGLEAAASSLREVWLEEIAGDFRTGRNGLYRSRGDVRALLEPSRIPHAVADLFGDSSHWLVDALRHGARVLRSGEDLAPRLLWLADLGAMLSLDPLAALVAKRVDLVALKSSKRRLRFATANWVTGALEVSDGASLDKETGHERIVAAAARPGIFPCVEIDGAPLVDASAFASSDLASALEAGAKTLHVPLFLARRGDADRPESTIDALDRMLAELQIGRLERELSELRGRKPTNVTVHLYRGRLGPAESHGFLDLRRGRIEALLDHGREIAQHHDCHGAGCLIAETSAN